jgi:hypothetical protein
VPAPPSATYSPRQVFRHGDFQISAELSSKDIRYYLLNGWRLGHMCDLRSKAFKGIIDVR